MASEDFARIWTRYGEELRRSCLAWMSGRRDDADEAFSRAGAVAFQKFESLAPLLENPRGWLFKLTYHACMDLHRERRRRRELGLDSVEAEVESRQSLRSPDPEQRLLRRERRELIRRWIDALPARLRVTVSLYAYDHLSYRDIAGLLDISEANVRKRMQEARQLLRDWARASCRAPPRVE